MIFQSRVVFVWVLISRSLIADGWSLDWELQFTVLETKKLQTHRVDWQTPLEFQVPGGVCRFQIKYAGLDSKSGKYSLTHQLDCGGRKIKFTCWDVKFVIPNDL